VHLADAIDAVLRSAEPVRALIQEATAPDRAPGDRRIAELVGTLKGNIDEARRVLGVRKVSGGQQPRTPVPEQGAESAPASAL